MLRQLIIGLAGMALFASPVSGRAEHCGDRMVIFSGQAGLPKPNPNAAMCALTNLTGQEIEDTRLILPAATEVTVRWLGDFGDEHPEITAKLDGLGFTGQTIALARDTSQASITGVFYESESFPLAGQSGCISTHLTAAWGGPAAGSTAFHTYDSACPGN